MGETNWVGVNRQIDFEKFDQMLIEKCLLHPRIAMAYIDNLQRAMELDNSEGGGSVFLTGVKAFGLEMPKIPPKTASKVEEVFTTIGVELGKELRSEFITKFENHEQSILQLAKDMRLEKFKTLVDQTTVMSLRFSELLPDLVDEYFKADSFSVSGSSDPECHITLFNEIVDRESEHINRYIQALPAELAVAEKEMEAQEFIIKRHVEIIDIIDRGLSFHKKYLETQGVGITTTGAEIFINAFNKYRKILFKDYLKIIRQHCNKISLKTDEYLRGRWSINKTLQRLVSIGRWKALQDEAIKEVDLFKEQIDDMYSVLEELVEMTKDTGMKKALRLTIENAEQQLAEVKEDINITYDTYLQDRNSLKRYS